jgi:glycosyltransferase involved in cell wall biosynthesis
VTGFVVDDIEHAVEAVKRLPELSRRDCRAAFERRFTAARMAEDYLALYDRMVKLVAAAPATELPPWGAA